MQPVAMHPMYQSHGIATSHVNISPYYEPKAYPHSAEMQHVYPSPFAPNVYPFAPTMLSYEAQPWYSNRPLDPVTVLMMLSLYCRAYGPIQNAEDEIVDNAENQNYPSFGQARMLRCCCGACLTSFEGGRGGRWRESAGSAGFIRRHGRY